MNWKVIQSENQLDLIVKESFNRPQLIFKHSTTCPISGMAKRRLDSDNGQLDAFDAHYLDLLSYRNISSAIAQKFQVHHESPQVIIVHNGEASYDESHLDISVEDVLSHYKYMHN